MNCACTFIEESTDNEIANPDMGQSLLEEFQKIKKGFKFKTKSSLNKIFRMKIVIDLNVNLEKRNPRVVVEHVRRGKEPAGTP